MQPTVYKVCPQCRQPADVDAPSCAGCGHAFRTQFANQTQFFQQAPQGAYQNPPSPYCRPNPFGLDGGHDEQNLAMTMWLLMIVTQFISPLVFLVLGQNSRFIRANALIALGVELFAYLVFLLLVVGANFAGSYDSVFY